MTKKENLTKEGKKQLSRLIIATEKVFKKNSKEYKTIIKKHAGAWKELANK